MLDRCGRCKNCLDLERVRSRVLAVCNSIRGGVYPSSHHADDGTVKLWNQELARLPCLKEKADGSGMQVPRVRGRG